MNKCGYIAIVGRPNVGKSTLLNRILGQKISITSRTAQTTRHNILGIKTEKNVQAIYVDTPGFHIGRKRALNRYMRRAVKEALLDVNVVVFIVDRFSWQDEDDMVLEKLKNSDATVILAINKVDKIKDKNRLLPYIKEVSAKYAFKEIIPLSAQKGTNVAELEQAVHKLLPQHDFIFAEDQLTDKSERFLVAEIIREKLTRLLGQELPHQLMVEIEKFQEEEKIIRIAAVIYVERHGQKIIIIGKKGAKLKEIATKAREDIETLLQNKVFLQVWVKVKPGWSDSERVLRDLVYGSNA